MFRRLILAAVLTATAACGGARTPAAPDSTEPVELRLGYFPNITHAAAIAGVEKGIFAKHLGPNVTLRTSTFNAGPAAVESLFADAIDATYIGPNPAINAYAKSGGEAIRIIAGATSGGAALVTKPEITSPAQLKGRKLATPQLGNTQDVALRAWLKEHDLTADQQGGGDVAILPQENAQTLETFRSGHIDGAWVPEPWATRLVKEGGGKVLVDEKTLWAEGRFVTTHLIVATTFLNEHPDVVKQLLEGHLAATDYVRTAGDAKQVVNDGIAKLTGKPLKPEIIDAAWANLEFTADPIASSLRKGAQSAIAIGLLTRVDLKGIYDVKPLNALLRASGKEGVRS